MHGKLGDSSDFFFLADLCIVLPLRESQFSPRFSHIYQSNKKFGLLFIDLYIIECILQMTSTSKRFQPQISMIEVKVSKKREKLYGHYMYWNLIFRLKVYTLFQILRVADSEHPKYLPPPKPLINDPSI
jgi:hypothetical protein